MHILKKCKHGRIFKIILYANCDVQPILQIQTTQVCFSDCSVQQNYLKTNKLELQCIRHGNCHQVILTLPPDTTFLLQIREFVTYQFTKSVINISNFQNSNKYQPEIIKSLHTFLFTIPAIGASDDIQHIHTISYPTMPLVRSTAQILDGRATIGNTWLPSMGEINIPWRCNPFWHWVSVFQTRLWFGHGTVNGN